MHLILLAELLPTEDLHKVLAESVSAFSSFMREYLDPVVKADHCSQNVDDIGMAVNNATDLTRNIRAISKCIRRTGLNLTIEKCHVGVRQVQFLGRTISPEGISPPGKFNFSWTDLERPSQKRCYSDIWVSYTFTEIIFQGWLKNLTNSKNCLERKCQSISRQN